MAQRILVHLLSLRAEDGKRSESPSKCVPDTLSLRQHVPNPSIIEIQAFQDQFECCQVYIFMTISQYVTHTYSCLFIPVNLFRLGRKAKLGEELTMLIEYSLGLRHLLQLKLFCVKGTF